MIARIDEQRRVTLRAAVDLPVSADFVWSRMRDFERFTALDPIHHRIRALDGPAAQGSRIIIEHRFGPVRIDRVGRILRWREGIGYTICDLSARGVDKGFPHTIGYHVESTPTGARWSITVRGKWTARWIPPAAARLWMRWILRHIVVAVEVDVLRAARDHSAAMRRSISA